VFPSGWLYCRCCLSFGEYPDREKLDDFAVRLLAELGARDVPFRVKFH
jgi:hypothetical protein